MPGPWLAATDHLLHPLFVVIDQLHNGIIGDYVAWIIVGLALLSLSFIAIGL